MVALVADITFAQHSLVFSGLDGVVEKRAACQPGSPHRATLDKVFLVLLQCDKVLSSSWETTLLPNKRPRDVALTQMSCLHSTLLGRFG